MGICKVYDKNQYVIGRGLVLKKGVVNDNVGILDTLVDLNAKLTDPVNINNMSMIKTLKKGTYKGLTADNRKLIKSIIKSGHGIKIIE